MLPTSIKVAKYKCFRADARLELRPITLIFGDNNTGKSALLRTLPAFADSSDAAPIPPLAESGALGGATFAQLQFYGGDADESRDIEVSLKWEDDLLTEAVWTLQRWVEGDKEEPIVKHLAVSTREGRWGLLHVPKKNRTLRQRLYRLSSPGGINSELEVEFCGLVPRSPDLEWARLLEERLDDFSRSVRWLRAVRESPERLREQPGAAVGYLESSGENAIDVLIQDKSVREAVSAFLVQHLERELAILPVPPGHFRTILRCLDVEIGDVDLIDSGDGPAQLLPVLVALEMARQEAGVIVALEEPESHLHPSLERALGEHLCSVAASAKDARIVVETHSQVLLLSLQLAVARGDLDPDAAMVHWVQQGTDGVSSVERIEINERGELVGNWPPDVFGDPTEIAREWLRARRSVSQK